MSIKYGYEIDLNSDSTAAKVVKLVGENKEVLEFGCSYGYMSEVLKKEFSCNVVGIEIDPEAAEKAKTICDEIIIGNAETIDYKEKIGQKKFDVIIFADVLEHLVAPEKLLYKVSSYLKNDGYIIASIPNVSYLGVTLEIINGSFRYRPLGILDNTHLRFFTIETIHELFEASGFYIELIDRTKANIDITEFKMNDYSIEPDLLNYIKNLNQEWNTYQFIIKANKCSEYTRVKLLSENNYRLEENIKELNVLNKSIKEENTKLNELLDVKNLFNEKLSSEIENVKEENIELHNLLDTERSLNEKLSINIESLGYKVKENKEEACQKQFIIDALNMQLTEKDKIIKDQRKIVIENQEQIARNNQQLNHIYSSDGWKSLLKYYKVRDKLFPLGSKKRSIIKYIFRWNNYAKKSKDYVKANGIKAFGNKVKQKINNSELEYVNDKPINIPKITMIDRDRENIQQENLTISVIVPTKNAGDDFENLLKMLSLQKGFKKIEIIIVDSGSSDDTIEISKSYGAKIISIASEKFTHSYARNLGAENASGEYFLFTTQDVLLPSLTWIYEMYSVLKKNDVVAVSCAEFPRNDADLFYRTICWNHYKFLEVDKSDKIMSMPSPINHINLRKNGQLSDLANLISRNTFEKYKYRYNYAEDLDLGIRLIKDGYNIAFLSSIRVIHSHNRESYYFLKRGYVDSIFLTNIFDDFQFPYINPNGYFNDIIFTYEFLNNVIINNILTSDINIFKENILMKFEKTESLKYPNKINENKYVDKNFKKFIDRVFIDFYENDLNSNCLYNGILVNAARDFIKMIFNYMENTYEKLDENIIEDFYRAIYKAFAQLVGAHMAYCYLKNKDNDVLKDLDLELRKGV